MAETASASTATRPDHRCDIGAERMGPVRIVRVAGRLDWATVGGFREVLRETTEAAVVIINLDRADLDAAGTGVIMAATATARRHGQTLVFVVTNPIALEVLDSLGLPLMAAVVGSEAEALALAGPMK